MCEISPISASTYSLFMLQSQTFFVHKEMGAISIARMAGPHAEI
jgi:hypothetical protein